MGLTSRVEVSISAGVSLTVRDLASPRLLGTLLAQQ